MTKPLKPPATAVPKVVAPRPRGATRARVIDAALRLFAGNGFDGTAVRDIEEAAGLTPGRGSFYRHFESKEAVFAAVLARETARLEQLRDQKERAVHGTLGDRRAEMLAEFRLVLASLADAGDLLHIMAREAGRFPALMQTLSRQLIDESRALRAKDLRAGISGGFIKAADAKALTAVIDSALIGYHLTTRYFGKPPAGIGEEAFVGALGELLFAKNKNEIIK